MSRLPILRVFVTAMSGFASFNLATAGFFNAAFETNVTQLASALPNAPNIGR